MSVTENWMRSPVMDAVHFQALNPTPPISPGDRGPTRASWVHSFFDLPADVVARVEADAKHRVFRRGETIIRRGDRAERLYMVVRGQVKLLLGAKGREDLLISVVGSGQLFGD